MTISTLRGAKTLCEITEWDITNIELHKILYLCHVMYAGTYKSPLFKEDFEAWDYGPVLPTLYEKMKCFGAEVIFDIFGVAPLIKSDPSEKKEYDIIEKYGKVFYGYTPSELINITHCRKGAWDKNYKSGVRGIIIPFEDILQEYVELYEPKGK